MSPLRYNLIMLVRQSYSRGFTVVELAVVIAVIAIMATIAFFGYQQIQMQARDSKRQTDIAAMQSAIDSYYRKNNEYPDANDTAFFAKLTEQGIIDPTDTPGWNNDRNQATGYCAAMIRRGGGEGQNGSCRNYAYQVFNNAYPESVGDDGREFTGCRVYQLSGNAQPWYYLMWYNEQTKTIYYKGGNVGIEKQADSYAFPGQKCVLQ